MRAKLATSLWLRGIVWFCVAVAASSTLSAASLETERGDLVAAPTLNLTLLIAAALLPPMALWCGLATRCALREDLSHEPRRARSRLLRWCAEMKRRAHGPTRKDLNAWRDEVRALWRIETAAPSAQALAERGGLIWGQLWDEAEAALFARDATLPADWLARTEEAVTELRLTRTASPWPGRARHWLPMALLFVVAWATAPGLHAQSDAPTTAQRIQRATAAMQAEKWEAAHAQWAAAFLHEPRNPTVRAGLRETLGRVAAADATTRRLTQGRWFERIAGLGTPGEWELLAWSGAALPSGVLCVGLWLGYAGTARRWRYVLGCFGAVGVVGLFGSWAAFCSYGALAHPMVACVSTVAEVRPVASEVVPRAHAQTLLPGTMVVIDRSFLGWDHVTSVDGRTVGWLRSEAAVWAYRTRDDARLAQVYFKTVAD